MAEVRSAIDWHLVSRARRLQEKLERYFDLLRQVQELEGDPDLAPFLAGDAPPGEVEVAPALKATAKEEAVPMIASEPKTPGAGSERRRQPRKLQKLRGDGDALLKLAVQHAPAEFDGQDLVSIAQSAGHELARLSPKQANDHLRRLAASGRVVPVAPGKRGKSGMMPRYAIPEAARADSEGA